MRFIMRNAFTMVELVFVIVVIGILSAVAIPKLAPIVSTAKDAKGKSTLASVRSALATERQKLVLAGEFGDITKLRNESNGSAVFTKFVYTKGTGTATGSKVLEYELESCSGNGCWSTSDGVTYTYSSADGDCTFKLANNRFDDNTTGGCSELIQ